MLSYNETLIFIHVKAICKCMYVDRIETVYGSSKEFW